MARRDRETTRYTDLEEQLARYEAVIATLPRCQNCEADTATYETPQHARLCEACARLCQGARPLTYARALRALREE